MFWQIVRKEILESLLGVRFTLAIVFSIVLFAASTFFSVDRYRAQSQEYWRGVNENLAGFKGQSDQLCKLAFYEQNAYRQPKVLALCAGGSEDLLPGHFTFNGFDISLPQIAGQSNFTLPRFSDLDWAFIISLVLSFTAFVFAYDCICGEKETGTLRLILSGATPRVTLLLAKYVGLMLTLAIPLFMGLAVALIILIASGAETAGLIPWARILGIVLTSFLYLSIFVFLGLFVSARSARPSNSMVALLLAWVVLLIVIPSMGRVVADKSRRAPTAEEFKRAKSEAQEQIDSRMYAGAYGPHAGATGSDRNDPSVNPRGRAQYSVEGTEAVNRVVDAHHERMMAQAEAGRRFTCTSPAVIYRRVCEIIACTGIDRSRSLYRQIRIYQQSLRGFIVSEDRSDPDSLHLLFDDAPRASEWTTISHKAVSFEAVPKFLERDLAFGESLRLAVWDLGLLALFNLVFFALSFVAFMKYDVR
jgi:ABC-type transport system involved in multi-copper enzyme maturation permease subunit